MSTFSKVVRKASVTAVLGVLALGFGLYGTCPTSGDGGRAEVLVRSSGQLYAPDCLVKQEGTVVKLGDLSKVGDLAKYGVGALAKFGNGMLGVDGI